MIKSFHMFVVGNNDVCGRDFVFFSTLNFVNNRNPTIETVIPIRDRIVIGTENNSDVTTIANKRLRQLRAACLTTEILVRT